MRTYAAGTRVGESRSREQIGRLLREFGASGIQWSDEFVPVRSVTLRFIWTHEGVPLTARHRIIMDYADIEERCKHARSGRLLNSKFEREVKNWSNEVHRTLLLFLKGSLYAIANGIIKAEQLFLAMIEDVSGQTVGEIMSEKLASLPRLHATALLLTNGRRNANNGDAS